MAEKKDPRDKRPVPRKQDLVFSNPPDAAMAGSGENVPPVLRRAAAKAKKKLWVQQNQVLAIGLAAGVGVLVILLILGFAFGMFGSGGSPKPTPVAAQPAAPPPPATPPAQSASSQPTPPQPTAPQPTTTQSPPPSPGGGLSSTAQPTPSGQAASPAGQTPAPDAKKDEPKQVKPLVPEEVAKWKPADYKLARRNNHPKLLEAIARLGEKKYFHSNNAAKCLVDLLKPLPPEKPPAGASPSGTPGPQQPQAPGPMPQPGMPHPVMPQPGTPRAGTGQPGGLQPGMPQPGGPAAPNSDAPRPYSPGDLTTLVQTIIEALGCNGSGLAQATLEHVLAGTFATDDDKAAVEATLKTMLAHPSEEGDDVLLRAATAAKELRSADHEGPWPAKDLETKAFDLVKQSASFGLRTKLASFAVGKRMRLDPKDPITEFLLLANPLNCGAQLLFYEKSDLKKNKELKTTLEQQFLTYSSTALARCLGISADNLPATAAPPSPIMPGGGVGGPPGLRPAGGAGGFGGGRTPPPIGGGPARPSEPAKAADVDLGSQLAAQLWSDQFRKLIEPQVGEAHSLDKQPQLLVLAATIPEDSTRAILAKLLKKHWYDGPEALETAGLLDRAITDPALLPIIKAVGKRHESSSTPKVTDAVSKRGKGPVPAAPGGGGKKESLQKKQKAEQDWMDVSAKLAAGWCKRFAAAAAKDGDEASDKPAGNGGEPKLPSGFELPSAAKVTASHRVVLPAAAPAGFSQVQPSTLEVYYVRAEESAKPKKAIAYYARQTIAKPTDTRTFEGKTWIESPRSGPQNDRLRSIDVLISRPDGSAVVVVPEKGKAAAEDEVDLIIEVLIIEIKDPKQRIGEGYCAGFAEGIEEGRGEGRGGADILVCRFRLSARSLAVYPIAGQTRMSAPPVAIAAIPLALPCCRCNGASVRVRRLRGGAGA